MKQSKKWMLVVLALLALVALPLVGCKNDSVSETRGEIEQTPPADGTETGDNEDVPAKYTIIFNTNEGGTVQSQTVESGKTATEPADPTREGFTFEGWYSDSNFTTTYNFSSPVTGDITIHAKWTPNKVDVVDVTPPTNPTDIGLSFDPETKIFTASEGYDSYTWYVDREKQKGETENIFNVSSLTGYPVVLVVAQKDDKTYSAQQQVKLTSSSN